MNRAGKILAASLFILIVGLPEIKALAQTTWTGCYAGLHAGALTGMVDHKVTGFPVDPSYQRDVTFRSATAGAHAGCNYQQGTFVLGVEGDLNWASVDDSVVAFRNEDTERLQHWRDRMDWFGTLRARFGMAKGKWHAYATGGLAFSDLQTGFEDFRFGALQFSKYKSSKGWVAGGGLEYMIQPQWVARLEYLYHQFDNRLILVDGGNTFRGHKPHFHTVRVGVTRRFGM